MTVGWWGSQALKAIFSAALECIRPDIEILHQGLVGSYLGFKKITLKMSLMVQCLRLQFSSAGGLGSIPGQRIKIPHAMQCGKKKKLL